MKQMHEQLKVIAVRFRGVVRKGTSRAAALILMASLLCLSVHGEVRIDFNYSTVTAAGWIGFSSGDMDLGTAWSTMLPDGITISVHPAGDAVLSTRDRRNLNGSGDAAMMWRDFLFAEGSDSSADGMDIELSGLRPRSVYPVRIWAYDSGSIGLRQSSWNDVSYSFDGAAPAPTGLEENQLLVSVISDGDGKATLRGRAAGQGDEPHHVFINGMEIGDPSISNTAPVDIHIAMESNYRNDPAGSLVATLTAVDPEAGDSFTFALVDGQGDMDNHQFAVDGDQLLRATGIEQLPSRVDFSIRLRATDTDGEYIEQSFLIRILPEPGSVQPVMINEFSATGTDGYVDGDGRANDWIELFNSNPVPVDLEGYYLSDDPGNLTRWSFPQVSIAAGGYLVIFASSPESDEGPVGDYVDSEGFLHAGFSLAASGEYLALSSPEGDTILSSLDPQYPSQVEGTSYGIGEDGQWHYLSPPTPGRSNESSQVPFDGVVGDTSFSTDRGFYDDPIEVGISTETPGATVFYTLDGSLPSPEHGEVYRSPVPVSTTTTLRAMAWKEGWRPSNVDTQTYIFVDDVATQPADPPGWPDNWGTNDEVDRNDGAGDGTVPADYEMDPRVAAGALPGYGLREALLDIPSVSIAMDPDDFITPGRGIYSIPQSRIEKYCSIEYILPDGSRGFQEDCKIEVHGNSSRRPWRMQKHSMRLTFTSEIGVPRLRYPLFPESPVEEFNQLVLRACFTDSWGLVSWGPSRYRPNDSQYIRDVWMKESLRDMGQPSSYGNFVHLYVNGLYFGLHNLTERLSDDFFASHLGGSEEDWEINEDFSSPGPVWNRMMGVNVTTGTGYRDIQQFIDLTNFADYYILHLYADSEDWPHHNGYAAVNPVSGDGRYRFFVWDQEIVLDKFSWNRYDAGNGVGAVFQKMRASEEFRLLFADRVNYHLNGNGALSLHESQRRYRQIADRIDRAIVAESARWGDTQSSTPYGNSIQQPSPLTNVNHDHYPPAPNGPDFFFTREDSWLMERDNVLNNYLPTLHDRGSSNGFINELRRNGLYPSVDAPAFSKSPGYYPAGTELGISQDPLSTVYYTLDGSDPRQLADTDDRYHILLPEDAGVQAIVPAADYPPMSEWTDILFPVDERWLRGARGIGYETSPADYRGLYGVDVSSMRNVNTSALARFPFAVDLENLETAGRRLILDLRYDDGFVAWINGHMVASANAPEDGLRWDSAATDSHADGSAAFFQSFDITESIPYLVDGRNILAIQALNHSLTSSDLLMVPRIILAGNATDGVSPGARVYEEPFTLDASRVIKARALKDGEWSALTVAAYSTQRPADNTSLIISEIHYNPDGVDDLEFVEITNISGEVISIDGIKFTDGIELSVDSAAQVTMDPGESVVAVRSVDAFSAAWPGVRIIGGFEPGMSLSNAGETITLVDRSGMVIQSFSWGDSLPWPEDPDGGGPSLELIDPMSGPDPSDPRNWRASLTAGGSPGSIPSTGFTGDPTADADKDGLNALLEYALGTSDHDPADGPSSILPVLMAGAGGTEFFELHLSTNPDAAGIRISVQFSDNVGFSDDSAIAVDPSGTITGPDGTVYSVYRSGTPVAEADGQFARIMVSFDFE